MFSAIGVKDLMVLCHQQGSIISEIVFMGQHTDREEWLAAGASGGRGQHTEIGKKLERQSSWRCAAGGSAEVLGGVRGGMESEEGGSDDDDDDDDEEEEDEEEEEEEEEEKK